MSLETIVQNMVTANEPEANIAQVIKHYNQINGSPLNQIEEVETETQITECDGEGMVWNEAEGKCVPEASEMQQIDIKPTIQPEEVETQPQQIEIQKSEISPTSTTDSTVEIDDQTETEKLVANTDPQTGGKTPPSTNFYGDPDENNVENNTKVTEKIVTPPGKWGPGSETVKELGFTMGEKKRDMNSFHDIVLAGLNNPKVLQELSGKSDLSYIDPNNLRNSILAKIKDEYPEGYNNLTPKDIDGVTLNAVDFAISNKRKKDDEEYKNVNFEVTDDGVVPLGAATTLAFDLNQQEINALNPNDKQIYLINNQLEDPNLSTEKRDNLQKKLNQIYETTDDTYFIDSTTGGVGDLSVEIDSVKEKYANTPKELLGEAWDDILLTSAGLKKFGKQTADYIVDQDQFRGLKGSNFDNIEKYLEDKGYKSKWSNEAGGLVWKDIPLDEMATWGDFLSDKKDKKFAGETIAAIKRINPNGEIVDIDPDELLKFEAEKASILAEKAALKDLYLLNKKPKVTAWDKAGGMGRNLVEGLGVSKKNIDKVLGPSARESANIAKEILNTKGIKLDKDTEEVFEVGLGESLGNKAANMVGFVGGLVGIQKYGINPLLARTAIPKILNKWRKGTSLEKMKALMFNAAQEEFKMQIMGAPTGHGAAFTFATSAVPRLGKYFNKRGYNQLETVLETIRSGAGFTVGTNAVAALDGVYDQIKGNKEFQTSMEELYPDWKGGLRHNLEDFLLGGMLRIGHSRKLDYKTSNNIRNNIIPTAKQHIAEAQKKLNSGREYKNTTTPDGKPSFTWKKLNQQQKNKLEQTIEKNQELLAQATNQLEVLNGYEQFRNPNTRDKAWENKIVELQEQYPGLDVKVEVLDNPKGKNWENGQAANWLEKPKGEQNVIQVRSDANPEKLVHEITHEYQVKKLGESPRLKKEFTGVIKEVFSDIKTSDKSNLWKDIQRMSKEENWTEEKLLKEIMAYGTEYMNKPENYRQLVAQNAFQNLKNKLVDFGKEKLGYEVFNKQNPTKRALIKAFLDFGKGKTDSIFEIVENVGEGGISKPGNTKGDSTVELIGDTTTTLSSKNLEKQNTANERDRRVLDNIGNSPDFKFIIEGKGPEGKKLYETLYDKIDRSTFSFATKDGRKINLNDLPGFNKADFISETMASILPAIKKFNPNINDSFNNYIGAIIKKRNYRSVDKAFNQGAQEYFERINETDYKLEDPTPEIGEAISFGSDYKISKEIIKKGGEKLDTSIKKLQTNLNNISSTKVKSAFNKTIKGFLKGGGKDVISDLKKKFKGKNFIDYIEKNPQESMDIFLKNNKFTKGKNRAKWENQTTSEQFVEYFKGEGLDPNLTRAQRTNAIAARKKSFIDAVGRQVIEEQRAKLEGDNLGLEILASKNLEKLSDKEFYAIEEVKRAFNVKTAKEAQKIIEDKLSNKLSKQDATVVENILIKEAGETFKEGNKEDKKFNKLVEELLPDTWVSKPMSYIKSSLADVLEGRPPTPPPGKKYTPKELKEYSQVGKDIVSGLNSLMSKFKDGPAKDWLIKNMLGGHASTYKTGTGKLRWSSEGALKPFMEKVKGKDGAIDMGIPPSTKPLDVINRNLSNIIKELPMSFKKRSEAVSKWVKENPQWKDHIEFSKKWNKEVQEWIHEKGLTPAESTLRKNLGAYLPKTNSYTGTQGDRSIATDPTWINLRPLGGNRQIEHMVTSDTYSKRLMEARIKGTRLPDPIEATLGDVALRNLLDYTAEGISVKNNTSALYRFASSPRAIETAKWTFNPETGKTAYETIIENTGKKVWVEMVKEASQLREYNTNEAKDLKVDIKDVYTPEFINNVVKDGNRSIELEVLNSKNLDLNKDFNKMLEESKGVKADAVYSPDRAEKIGKGKGKYKFFVPYSAEDFLGLTYATLGKGKQGEAHQKWYQDNLIDPYSKGVTNYEVAKQAAMRDWKYLKDQIQNTPSNLKKEATRGFTNEDALRTYMWAQKGTVPETLSKKDVKALVNHVENSPELKGFAEQIASITKGDGYPAPGNNWMAGNIRTDLLGHVNEVSRGKYLEEWQTNVDAIYTPENMNKLKATFGNNYVESLQDALYRMKTGRNRPSGTNKLTNGWLNWVNDSVGTVMFLNQRSALLQTISSVNYMNWGDNNPAKAAMAFGNQKQFWKDFGFLFNSDYLKQRRSGLKTDVNADEIASSAATSQNKARAAASWILKQGFLPTQIADSFAISMGGASFYRNRLNSYKKEGLSEKEAQEKAFNDFRQISDTSQQSSDPSKISTQQSGPLGRLVLAFANTPMQYTRLTKRAAQDLMNGRGDWKTNVSKIAYYGAVQNMIFAGLQQAMFGIAFDPSEEGDDSKLGKFKKDREDQATGKIINSTADMFLRGSGVGGAFVASIKNIILEAGRQSGKNRPDYERAADKFLTFSPVIDSKLRKLKSAGRTFTYKQELKKIQERGVAIDNPALMAVSQVLSAYTNIPLDRAVKKINNIKTATEDETQLWQKIALLMGYGSWELGIQARKTDEAAIITKQEKAQKKGFKTLQKNIDKGTKKKTPIKALQNGVIGKAHKDGTIEVDPSLSPKKKKEVVKHEKRHLQEIKSGKLNYDANFVYYGKKKFQRKNGQIAHAGKWKKEGDHSLPWEKFAYNA